MGGSKMEPDAFVGGMLAVSVILVLRCFLVIAFTDRVARASSVPACLEAIFMPRNFLFRLIPSRVFDRWLIDSLYTDATDSHSVFVAGRWLVTTTNKRSISPVL
ncbi:hypothetical protein PHYPSEUDO_001850 [Phytophthora pseudosyringae]|uniref:Uncharacterized protein n=1 Tax=Phytophthora pseudosyringae TaxID=221518 RepID=A0A8T1VV61_9STRA|nr:hypothetical protein PHYPSEUDO_001850 [Phytophthora pseudosyringae]